MEQKRLSSLINKIKWVKNESTRAGRGGANLKSDEVSISFLGDTKEDVYAKKFRLRFGSDVIAKLGWEKGDKIMTMNDPDNLMFFLAVKSKTGYNLSKENKSTSYAMQSKWSHSVKIPIVKNKIVHYEIADGQLVFEVKD